MHHRFLFSRNRLQRFVVFQTAAGAGQSIASGRSCWRPRGAWLCVPGRRASTASGSSRHCSLLKGAGGSPWTAPQQIWGKRSSCEGKVGVGWEKGWLLLITLVPELGEIDGDQIKEGRWSYFGVTTISGWADGVLQLSIWQEIWLSQLLFGSHFKTHITPTTPARSLCSETPETRVWSGARKNQSQLSFRLCWWQIISGLVLSRLVCEGSELGFASLARFRCVSCMCR